MQKKIIPLGIAAVLVVGALLAFLTITLSGAAFGSDPKEADAPAGQSLVGTWVDTSTGVDVTYTAGGVFQLQGSDVATYTTDNAAGTITLHYAQAYGGTEKVMTYVFNADDTLSVTETDTGMTYTYTRGQ
ncbi:MAG: hypothetical protein Q4C55_00390 [Eubacterium sp.]|nr:hypothetical protein [Eubacterium sp.]